MEEARRQVLRVLLKRLYDRGLLDQAAYDGAVNLVNTRMDLPEFFRSPSCGPEEDEANGGS